nr:microtubule-associated protein 9-like isoform X2 [Lepeophtheirus salmonis]
MSARELEDFIGVIEKAESCSTGYLTDIYSSSTHRFELGPDAQIPVPRLTFPPSTLRSSIVSSVTPSYNKRSSNPLRAPPFGRVIAKDLSPAITPESSPITRRKGTPSNSSKKKTISKKIGSQKSCSESSSRSSTPSPPRTALPVPEPIPKLTLRKKPTRSPPTPTINLKNYQKSLQLIGINIEPSDRNNDSKNEKLSNYRVPIRSPTLKTRLKERTQSLSDIKKTLDDGLIEIPLDTFKDIKKNLCDAVFEEWYFKKLESKANQKLKLEEDKTKIEENYECKKEKTEDNFRNWLRSKRNHKLHEDSNKDAIHSNAINEQQERKELKLQREKEWFDKKNKELKEKRKLEKEYIKAKVESENQKNELKRTENAKHFEEWSRVWSKKIKEKRLREREKHMKNIKEMKERKEVAELSFNAWLLKKEIGNAFCC